MSIYLDSAILEEARRARELGWVHGVTTNPTLMAKAGLDPEVVLSKLSELGFLQIYYQLGVSQSPDEMLAEALKANEIIRDGLVLKVAPTEVGFRFVSDHGSKFSCCVTAVFSPAQALIAREAGARYIAVYVNRATKQMGNGLGLVSDVAKVLAGSRVEILAASLKSVEETLAAFLAGAQHLTVPFDVLANLPVHPLSTKTLEEFAKQGIGITLEP
jgi:transaldolase